MLPTQNNSDMHATVHCVVNWMWSHEPCNSHDLTLEENVFQVRQGLQEYVILKVIEVEIWEAFQELCYKIR